MLKDIQSNEFLLSTSMAVRDNSGFGVGLALVPGLALVHLATFVYR
jgi:hypothetical protein